ncbi:MAG: restriction endonuclease subunit S [Clostridium paraputrificum]|uniref:restriction endonuclease subunit S n=1 Tax=Clostridium paraputrificum TaxID=29363 RepID=UPI001A9A46B1|nr:restriction endonuclease subunit S [Clostridium paraputrificum]
MKAQDLKNSVLQLAIQGKLVEQNPNDEPASVLLEKIKAEKEKLIKEKKIKREKPLPEIMEEEKPFEIPESWEWLRLSEIAWLSDGKKIENAKFPYLEVKYLRGSKEAEIKNKGKFIEKNNLVILVDGENSGEVFVVGENGYLGSTFKVLSYSKEIYWEYLMWLLRCYQEKFKNNKTGSAIPHLNKMLFKNLPIGLPPLEEQKRIVAKIEEVLEKIEEYDTIEKELSELEKSFPKDIKKSILQYAIQGKLVEQNPYDEPASVLLEKIKAEKEKLIKEKKIKREKPLPEVMEEEKPFEIPDNWEWARLASVLDVRDGTHDTPKYQEVGIPLITSKNLKDGKLDFENIKFISQVDHEKISQRSLVENGDILFAMIGSIGNPVVVKKDRDFSIKNVALFKTLPQNKINIRYLFYYLMIEQERMRNIASGGVQSFVSLSFLRGYIIPLPPLEEQKRIVKKIGTIMNSIDKLQSTVNNKDLLNRLVQAKTIEVEDKKVLISN